MLVFIVYYCNIANMLRSLWISAIKFLSMGPRLVMCEAGAETLHALILGLVFELPNARV